MVTDITTVSRTNLNRENSSCTKNTTTDCNLSSVFKYFRHCQADKIVKGSFVEDINTYSTSFHLETIGWVLSTYQEEQCLVVRG